MFVLINMKKKLVKRCGWILFYFTIVEKLFQVLVFSQVSKRVVEYTFWIRNLAATSEMCILDVGCSESLVSHGLVNNGCRVYGVDLRPYEQKPRRMRFVQSDISQNLLLSR